VRKTSNAELKEVLVDKARSGDPVFIDSRIIFFSKVIDTFTNNLNGPLNREILAKAFRSGKVVPFVALSRMDP
jgi:hypothetical protein